MDRIFIASAIATVWICIVVVLFLRKKKKTIAVQANLENGSSARTQPSKFLQEQTIRLEDGRFGMRVEFLKSDLDLEDLSEAGGVVFELKKFLEISRSKKNVQQKEAAEVQGAPEAIQEELDLNIPSLSDYEPPADEESDAASGETVYLAEKFILPSSENLLSEDEILKS